MPPNQPKFWVVRAGGKGEDEEFVLRSSIAMLRFPEVTFPIPSDKNAIQERMADIHPGKNLSAVGKWVGELDTFANKIQDGDFVVLPRKVAGRRIAVGTVTGPYKHREIAGELRHTRRVRWIRNDISRDEFGKDESFFNHTMTVFRIEKSVAERIATILEPEVDLESPEGLRRACDLARARIDRNRLRETAELLKKVLNASLEDRATESFLIQVWTNRSVWPGLSVNAELESALRDEEFRHWFAQETTGGHALEPGERIKRLPNIYKKTITRLQKEAGWHPKLQTLSALAVFFPGDFTGVANDNKLLKLLRKMGESKSTNRPVEANRIILDRLDDVIGGLDDSDLNQVAERMLLTVELYNLIGSASNGTDTDNQTREQRDHTRAESSDGPQNDTVVLPSLNELTNRVLEAAKNEGLQFEVEDIESLHCGLWADKRRHFAVLSGLSGTGKTKIASLYAEALIPDFEGNDDDRLRVIPVQPGWHDPGPLLGYVNPLQDPPAYVQPDCLKLLFQAGKKRSEPHVLILDEMNLSHPEQYLAPLLSAMEQEDRNDETGQTGGRIPLHSEEKIKDPVKDIDYPGNLVIIGTVNMDETTMGISDKVLDRAFTLEFWDIKPNLWFEKNPTEWEPIKECKDDLLTLLVALHDALKGTRRHFGWRVIAEVVGFLRRYKEGGGEIDADAVDKVIYAKVLPKLRGEDNKQFRDCLAACKDALKFGDEFLKDCKRKVEHLEETLKATGSASFWR